VAAATTTGRRTSGDGGTVAALIALAASAASALLALFARQTLTAANTHTLVFAGFLGLTLCLTVAVVDVYGKGTLSFAGSGLLAVGFLLGPGPAMVAAVCTAALLYVRTIRLGAKLHRALFNAATFALSAGISTEVVGRFAHGPDLAFNLGFSILAAAVYGAVNLGLLSFAMATAEEQRPIAIFNERFRWMVPYYVVSGPLALAYVTAYEKTGVIGLLAFVLPPLMMTLSVRQYVSRTRESVEEIRQKNSDLETLLDEVNKRHLATIAALSHSMEAKDSYTGGHTERVAEVSVAIGRRLGFDGADLDALEVGALLHDIGKIGIPEAILHKPGPLDDREWKVIQQHPLISERILSDIGLSPIVLDIARSSHERIDGKGYPHGLLGDDIPLAARIVLVADAFDALTSDRPYRQGRSVGRALEEIRSHAGTQFCERCVEALEQVFREEPQALGLGQLRVVDAGAA
jgi:putative nucleotidyltransferase with HDIG domain